MSWGKIKIDPADKLWSEYLRKLRGACEYCGKTEHLQCSHYHGRRKESVRFDEENCDVFCAGCHQKLENEKGFTVGKWNLHIVRLPKKYTAWKMEQLGVVRYNALTLRANKTVKKDRKIEVIRIKELLKQLK